MTINDMWSRSVQQREDEMKVILKEYNPEQATINTHVHQTNDIVSSEHHELD